MNGATSVVTRINPPIMQSSPMRVNWWAAMLPLRNVLSPTCTHPPSTDPLANAIGDLVAQLQVKNRPPEAKAGYLRDNPNATRQNVLAASASERIDVYEWLFKTSRKNAQDSKIRFMLEMEAFLEIHRMWQRLGYPFG